MLLRVTFNDKALAYFGGESDPNYYTEVLNAVLGGLGPSWESQGAEAKGRRGVLDKENPWKSYLLDVALNEEAVALVAHWAQLNEKDMPSYIEFRLNRAFDTMHENWRVGAHITVEPV